jgi:hypothetical protein
MRYVREDSIFGPSLCDLGSDPVNCRNHDAQATGSTRIAKVASAPLGRDVFAYAVDNVGPAVLNQLGANDRLGLAEAVAQKARARRLLLPDGHPDVLSAKAVATVSEVHDVTR